MGSEGLEDCIQKNVKESRSDDSYKESEPPFKKAKYAWQVKGKYHLKGTAEGQPEDKAQNEETSYNSHTRNSDEGEGCNGGHCCIEEFLKHSDTFMAREESSDDECMLRNKSPVPLVGTLSQKNQDYYLNKWQERQLVRGYLDNHVNEVIERFMPIASIDVGGIIDDCDSDGTVEDEGILMAIQSHGLHSSQGSWCSNDISDSKTCQLVTTQEIAKSALDNIQNAQNELLKTKEEESCVDFEMGFLDAAVAAAIEKKGLSSQTF